MTDTLTKIVEDANARADAIAPGDGGPITATDVAAKWDILTPTEQAGFRRMGMGPKQRRAAKPKAAAFVKEQVKKVSSTAPTKAEIANAKAEQAAAEPPKLTRTGAPRTTAWMDASGKVDLKIGSQFVSVDGEVSGTVHGRHTSVKDDVRIPSICSDDPRYAKGVEAATNGKAPKSFRAPASVLIYVPPGDTAPRRRGKKAA